MKQSSSRGRNPCHSSKPTPSNLQQKQQTQANPKGHRLVPRIGSKAPSSCVWFPPSLCFSSNSLFFLSRLDLMMLHYFSSPDSLFFLSRLDLMMLHYFSSPNSLFFLSRLDSSCFGFPPSLCFSCLGLHLHGTSSSLGLTGKSSHGESSSMELDLFTLDLAQQNRVLYTRFVRLLNSFKTLLTNEIF